MTVANLFTSPHLTGAVVDSGGLTVTAGGLTVSAGTTAVQALTATSATITGNLLLSTNNTFYQGKTSGGTPVLLLGVNAADRVIIDNSALGVTMSGAAMVTGDFAINTNKLTVAASSGNTAVAGTLAVTGAITATGGVVGVVTGSVTGNASTATTLATPRAINGVNFDGSAAITVTAAAGTLTGTTLNAAVVTSSLTTVGTLGSLAVAGDLTVNTNKFVVTGSTGTAVSAAFVQGITGLLTGTGTSGTGGLFDRNQVAMTGSAVAISSVSQGSAAALAVVRGTDGTNAFTDLVHYGGNVANPPLSQLTLTGSPTARTYTSASGVLRLSMSAAYTVACCDHRGITLN